MTAARLACRLMAAFLEVSLSCNALRVLAALHGGQTVCCRNGNPGTCPAEGRAAPVLLKWHA